MPGRSEYATGSTVELPLHRGSSSMRVAGIVDGVTAGASTDA